MATMKAVAFSAVFLLFTLPSPSCVFAESAQQGLSQDTRTSQDELEAETSNNIVSAISFEDFVDRFAQMEARLNRSLATIDEISRTVQEQSQTIADMDKQLARGCLCQDNQTKTAEPNGTNIADNWTATLNKDEIRSIRSNFTRPTANPPANDIDRLQVTLPQKCVNGTGNLRRIILHLGRTTNGRNRRDIDAADESADNESSIDLTAITKRCAFSAIRTQPLLGRNSSQIVKFQTTPVSEGCNFDPVAGVFIATIPGIYYFSFTMRTYDHKHIGVSLMLNDKPVVAMTTSASDRKVMQTQSVLLHLDVDDEVWLLLGPSEHFALYGNNNNNYNTFNGHLIYPDFVE
ncbi:uncharacterized protein [Ptychodera flava]|uniref:uncharacterized protein n=1 Tax=Ptychodera flava TaxID=63121 RepID=UPI00396A96B6